MPKLTLERAQEVLEYEPETGILYWKKSLSNKGIIGSPAGFKMLNGYIGIGIDNSAYYAHRLAWLLTHQKWPEAQIDHLNGNRVDNRLENLREADNRLNSLNKKRPRRDNQSGATGVHFDEARDQWKVDVGRKFIGRFATKEEAILARKEAFIKIYGHLPIASRQDPT